MSTSFSSPPSVSSSVSRAGSRAAPVSDKHWSCRQSPILDHRRLVGEDRVSCEVLERLRSLELYRQLQNRQRRAAEVEKVIAPADSVLGDAEHRGPRG